MKRPRRQLEAALRAARRAFPAANPYGVLGFGISRVRRRGRRLTHTSLTIYVEKKLARPERPVPPLVFTDAGKRVRLAPDVRATGRQALAHAAVATRFTGLHPGAPIKVGIEWGGVGCLLTVDGTPTHLLTCGHLFESDAQGTAVFAGDGPQATQIGRLVANLLDDSTLARSDLAFPMDAALVELTPQGTDLASSTASRLPVGGIRESGLFGLDVQAFLATANDFSEVTTTGAGAVDFPGMNSEVRGLYPVQHVLKTNGALTQPGDSGTILLTTESPRRAVGTCIGAVGTAMSLFEPFSRSIPSLAEATSLPLDIWTSPGSDS